VLSRLKEKEQRNSPGPGLSLIPHRQTLPCLLLELLLPVHLLEPDSSPLSVLELSTSLLGVDDHEGNDDEDDSAGRKRGRGEKEGGGEVSLSFGV